MGGRLKREEYGVTKHDEAFSKWEILVGPLDWKNYSLEKDGVERYRIHNLPISCSCPGVYELGVAATHDDLGRKLRKLDPNCIVVVYIGQADNVRTRLQHYGRVGSHLDHGSSISLSNESKGFCFQRGPGFFREIFSRGFPIVFRWAPLKNKNEAQKTEAKLLGIFDYAWNKGGNGSRRPDDILLKLDKIVSGTTVFHSPLRTFQTWKWRAFGRKRVGIQINAGMPIREGVSTACSDPECYQCFKLPLVLRSCSFSEDYIICGVALGDGSVCGCKPIAGRKRCGEHRGKRINGSISKVIISRQGGFETGQSQHVCGVGLEDGTICRELPVHGRKRCELHKGRRVSVSTLRGSC